MFFTLLGLLVLAACGDDVSGPVPSDAAMSMTAVSGDAQVGLPGETLPDPLVVQAEIDGESVAHELVNWVVVEGGGEVYAGTSRTDEDGYAREWWTLGDVGDQRLEVRAVDPTTGEQHLYASFEAEAVEELPEDPSDPGVPGDGTPDLVGHFALDEGSGSVATDGSDHENHGQAIDADWTSGVVGPGAIALDGEGAHVRVTNSGSLDLGGDEFTLAAWVRPEDLRGDGDVGIISKAHEGDGNAERYHLGIRSNGGLDVRRHSNGEMARLRTGRAVVDGEWQHVAAVYDGSNLIAFVNGEEVGRTSASGDLDASDRDLLIGKRYDDRFFSGAIDDARIYNHALSASDIAALHDMEGEGAEGPPEDDPDEGEDGEDGDDGEDGEDDLDPGNWDLVLADTLVRGDVVVPAGEAWLIGPNVEVEGNVRTVDGTIGMRPGSSLRFIGADPDRYAGGGMGYASEFSNDIGLWVDGTGVLDIRGTPKEGWNRTGTHPTWDADDEYWIAPTEEGDYEPRPWSPGDAIPQVDPRAPAAEVINVSRDIVIEGPGHILIHSQAPQRIEYVQLRNLGVSSASHGGEVLGRYALHLHHGGWGTEGTIIRGVAAIGSRGRVFVPHGSHGVTMRDNVSVNSYSQALWWDEGDVTHDLVVDGFAATGVAMPSSMGSSGRSVMTLGSGRNKVMRNTAVSGARGGRSIGFHWDTRNAHRAETSAVWTFDRGNVAHNNEGFGIRFWFNDKWTHHVQDHVSYRNGRGGIENGAYTNAIRYTDVLLLEDGNASTAPSHLQATGILHHSSSGTRDDDGGPSRYTRVTVEAPDGPALVIGRLRGTPETRQEFIDCELVPAAGYPAVQMPDQTDNPFIALFRDCGITPDDIAFPSSMPGGLEGSSIIIEHEDGRAWEITVEGGRKVVRGR